MPATAMLTYLFLSNGCQAKGDHSSSVQRCFEEFTSHQLDYRPMVHSNYTLMSKACLQQHGTNCLVPITWNPATARSSSVCSIMVWLTLHFAWITHPQLPNVSEAGFKHFHIHLHSQTCYDLSGLIPNLYYVRGRSRAGNNRDEEERLQLSRKTVIGAL